MGNETFYGDGLSSWRRKRLLWKYLEKHRKKNSESRRALKRNFNSVKDRQLHAHSVLVRFYCSVIRSILEYACQVFHCNLPLYLSEDIERIQRRALRVIFPDCSYSEGLAKAGLTTLYDRRSTLCKELLSDIDTQGNHKLSHLLPVRSQQNDTPRSTRAFAAPVCKTNRFRKSVIISHCM